MLSPPSTPQAVKKKKERERDDVSHLFAIHVSSDDDVWKATHTQFMKSEVIRWHSKGTTWRQRRLPHIRTHIYRSTSIKQTDRHASRTRAKSMQLKKRGRFEERSLSAAPSIQYERALKDGESCLGGSRCTCTRVHPHAVEGGSVERLVNHRWLNEDKKKRKATTDPSPFSCWLEGLALRGRGRGGGRRRRSGGEGAETTEEANGRGGGTHMHTYLYEYICGCTFVYALLRPCCLPAEGESAVVYGFLLLSAPLLSSPLAALPLTPLTASASQAASLHFSCSFFFCIFLSLPFCRSFSPAL
jgi:hypothetical protein